MSAKTLLIVEDDAIAREGLAVVLRNEGYTVVTAADGDEALDHLAKGPLPDLIVLDMMMHAPGKNGWRFLEKRKAIPALVAIPVVIVSGLDIGNKEWAVSLGAAGFIHKPYDLNFLFSEIRRYCGLPPTEPGSPQASSPPSP